jgi:hypothetical protein
MPTAYFRSWTFDTGVVLLPLGAFAARYGFSECRAAEAAATWHHINLPWSNGITFDAAYTKVLSVGPRLDRGRAVGARRLAPVTVAARRVSRQR